MLEAFQYVGLYKLLISRFSSWNTKQKLSEISWIEFANDITATRFAFKSTLITELSSSSSPPPSPFLYTRSPISSSSLRLLSLKEFVLLLIYSQRNYFLRTRFSTLLYFYSLEIPSKPQPSFFFTHLSRNFFNSLWTHWSVFIDFFAGNIPKF